MSAVREFVRDSLLSLNWRWLKVSAHSTRKSQGEAPSLVVVPCDPWSVVGSRGDEAMICAVLQDFRRRHPDGRVTIITAAPHLEQNGDAARIARQFGATYVYAWKGHFVLSSILRTVRTLEATDVVVLGADCMDGFWGVRTSRILLAVADICARLGLRSLLTPFSWNEKPAAAMIPAFRQVTPRLSIFVRDPVSLARFNGQLPQVQARLTADIAFGLEPEFSPCVKKILAEMEADRQCGKLVLGVNLNPALKIDVAAVARQLKLVDAAIYCIPHDYRGAGDLGELRQLGIGRLVEDELSAAELKALASGCDAMFTSRMHLGIAALGMGVPMGGFAYQGKFAGLLEHFRLPQDVIVRPDRLENFASAVKVLLSQNQVLKQQVAERLSVVRRMAQEVFA